MTGLEGNKLTVSQGTSLKMIYYIAGNFKAVKAIKLTAVAGQHAPLREFGGKQFHCYISCDLEVTNEGASCW